ncbi:MAG TPA: biotin--[acetyl-CoA-carboxylase] ligase [Acidimicrobiales bacterium]|nr:biotin--[acetyl-CoA-carboxylase] ligase [Acidimicrobiales bacterium]
MAVTVWRIERLGSVGSTNTHLRAQAEAGAPEGRVVVADFQSAGRGRHDRAWEAPERSSLLCSVLLRPTLEAGQRQWAVAAVALAARAALVRLCGLRVGLKWPNDLTVDDDKLAGVLAESSADGAVVVGLGVNLTYDGPPGRPATSVRRAAGVTLEPEALLDIVLEELERRRPLLDDADGRARLAEEYRRALVTLGRRVRVEQPSVTLEGVARAVDDAGRLVVATPDGEVAVAAGDVVHVRPAEG